MTAYNSLSVAQQYLICTLLGAAFIMLAMWVVLRRRSRKRAAVRAEIEARIAAEGKVAQDAAVKDNMERVLGRHAVYKREMAQRELDRYYGKRVKGEDPTYEEWCRAKGWTVDEKDEEVPAG